MIPLYETPETDRSAKTEQTREVPGQGDGGMGPTADGLSFFLEG